MDPYARRLAAARATAASWVHTPPKGDVIIAGSTGADPSARALMEAALDLPNALIVLPGFDRSMDAGSMATIAATPSHPQNAMSRTLRGLGYQADEVAVWPGFEATDRADARRALINEALAPADETAGWLKRLDILAGRRSREAFAAEGFDGLTLIEAADEEEEAWCAALLLREALETEGQTAALVTPDSGLARRVSALMRQWEVDLAPSGGTPLLQTRAGSLAAIIMDWTHDPTHPVAMLAALKHVQIAYPHDLDSFERYILRGPRRWEDWDELKAHVDRRVTETIARRRDGDTSEPRFAANARATALGMPGVRIVVLPSPLAPRTIPEVKQMAHDFAPEIVGLLTGK